MSSADWRLRGGTLSSLSPPPTKPHVTPYSRPPPLMVKTTNFDVVIAALSLLSHAILVFKEGEDPETSVRTTRQCRFLCKRVSSSPRSGAEEALKYHPSLYKSRL
ncbi:unnamed protein product [Linum trigynum]|uniref:Uncharacterized protein n=1 Tax=Linum trigynum TaxID=586398 RepID=A0AAV2F6G0_9ROSI